MANMIVQHYLIVAIVEAMIVAVHIVGLAMLAKLVKIRSNVMFGKKKPPKLSKVQVVNPYHLDYNGKTGYAQVVGRVEKKLVAIVVNNPSGKVNRIMKVIKRKFFSDFGGACTGLDIEATEFIFPEN